jgi:myosin heavy subunit
MLERDDTVSDVNLSNTGIDDMIKMGNLSEETILKNLKLRYTKNLIYVFAASFCAQDL